ncbi:MAG: hypothetical protein L3K17_09585 [Thermoplasmata archaeon]|nr:hypothetical protein [Thermoplasmata archaeon]
MRTLTPAERLVVGALLDSGSRSDRARIARAGLPTRTFETAAHRLLASGVVYDRYVPNPTRMRVPAITFGLARPFVERSDMLVRRWQSTPGNTVLWRTPEWVFAVFFRTPLAAPAKLPAELVLPAECSGSFFLTADSRDPQVPVYFDFAGSWAALGGSPAPATYPRPLPGAGESMAGLPGTRPPETERSVALALARRPFERATGGGGPRRRSPRYFPRAEQRALRNGLVEHIVLLDLAQLPAMLGGGTDGLAWVHGRLLDRLPPEGLLAGLRSRARLAPFLFATDERRILMGALSRTSGGPPPPAPGGVRRASVAGVLRQYLEEIEIVRSPLESITVVTDHRYERLLAAPGAGAGLGRVA